MSVSVSVSMSVSVSVSVCIQIGSYAYAIHIFNNIHTSRVVCVYSYPDEAKAKRVMEIQ